MVPVECRLCPRDCQVNRQKEEGVCRGGSRVKVASVMAHHGEERCLSRRKGSGTVFFSGCSLGCCFCQNHSLRDATEGQEMSVEELAQEFLRLEQQGVHNLNLVTPTHYRPWIIAAVEQAQRAGLSLPVVWNTSGYETLESVRALRRQVDIWLWDLKFYSSDLAEELACAPDYFQAALPALQAAVEQAGPPVLNSQGLLQRGVLVRLLILPTHADDATNILDALAGAIPPSHILLNLMGQYRPPWGQALPLELRRPITGEEYRGVVRYALERGFPRENLE